MLQREVAELLQNDFGDATTSLLTITDVRVTKDLGIAYVNVSALGDKPEQRKAAIRRVQELTPQIRHALAQRIRHDLKRVPELRFFLDETPQHAARMEKLFAQIREERGDDAESSASGTPEGESDPETRGSY